MTAKPEPSNPREASIDPVEVPALADTVDVNPASPDVATGIVKRAA